tara:strand:- start:847 stop:1068 length:222 start_codon:yes stop_codon:yes gene_type:complete
MEGYTGLNFGSYNLSEMTNLYFPSVDQSYFHSLDADDIWEAIQPVDAIYTPVDAVDTVYTSVDAVQTTYTHIF